MISILEGLFLFLFSNCDRLFETFAEHVAWIKLQRAFCTYRDERVGGIAIVREVELSDPVPRKAECHSDRIVKALRETRLGVLSADGRSHFRRLILKNIAASIYRIGAHIENRAGKLTILNAVVVRIDALREGRGEKMHLAQLARPDFVDTIKRGRFKMKPVGDHQLRTRSCSGIQHLLALRS